MAFNISGLVNNITGSIKNLGNQLGITTGNPGSLYPEFNDILTQGDAQNWSKLPLPYTFAVVGASGIPDRNFKEFQLPLAPQKIKQTEEFAINIKPVQGGTVVSHKGNRYKKLTIAGTTGLAPFRGTGGVDKFSGEAIFQPADLKYKSGYDVFNKLRNYFRSYYEYKKDMQNDRFPTEARLIWKNYKDGEFLIVDVITFDMDRNASKPLLYDYNIEFKVLGHFKFSVPPLSDLEKLDDTLNRAMSKIDLARGVFLRSSDILKQVESTYDSALMEPIRKTSLALKAGVGLVNNLADFPGNLIKSTVTAGVAIAALTTIFSDVEESKVSGTGADNPVLQRAGEALPNNIEDAVARKGAGDALLDLGEAMLLIDASQLPAEANTGLETEIANAQDLPRSFYEQTIDDIERIKSNAEDFFNLGSADYDDIFGRTTTYAADLTKEISNDELDILEAFSTAISALSDVLAGSTLFKSTYDDQIEDLMSKFDDDIGLQTTAAVLQIVLPAKTDLERLALDYLGDSTRWPEIVELNGLQSPYITQDVTSTTTGVAKPGDTILVPGPSSNDFNTLPQGKEIAISSALSELEKSFGTDFKLTDDFDLSLNNAGDLDIINGSDNVGQAAVLKLGYEKGEVLHAPTIGANLSIGNKTPTLQELKDDVVRTLTQDPRVEKLEGLSVVQNNSAMYLNFKIKVKNVDIPVPVSIQL